MLETAGSEATY